MSNLNLKLILEMIDKITAPARKIKEGFVGNIQRMRDSVMKLSQSLKFNLSFSMLLIQERMMKMRDTALRVGDGMEKMGKKMAEAGGFFTGRLTLPLAGFGTLAIRSAGQMELLVQQFEGYAGSVEKAKGFVKELAAITENSPLGLDDVAAAAQAMMAAGYNTSETTTRIKLLGDIAVGAKKSVTELTNQYIALRTKGKADLGDLTGMVQQNIPVVDALAKQLGKTKKQVLQMAEAGHISFAQVKQAMESMTDEGGVFYQKMEKQSRGIFGVFDQLMKVFKSGLAEVGQTLYDELDMGAQVRDLTKTIRGLFDAFMALPKPVKSFIVWAGILAALLGPMVLVIGQLVLGVGLLVMGFGHLITVTLAVVTALRVLSVGLLTTPFGWFILAVTALAGIAYLVIKNWSKVSGFFTSMWSTIKTAFSTAIEWIMKKLEPLMNAMDGIRDGWNGMKSLVMDNPINQEAERVFNNDTKSGVNAIPVGAALGGRVDAGGTITVKIESDTPARVVDAKPNDRRMNYNTDTGLLMGGH